MLLSLSRGLAELGDEQQHRGPEDGSNDQNPQEASEGAQDRGEKGEAERSLSELGATILAGALDLAHSLITLLFILLHVVLDLGFIGGWFYAHYWFENEVLHDFPPFQGLNEMSLFVLNWSFSLLVLYAVLVHVIRDAVNIWHRTWGHGSSRNR